MSPRLWFTTIAVAALTAGCSSSGSDGATESSQPAGGSGTVTITVKDDHLTAPDGKTLYYNTIDTATKIQCTGECASEWPPLTGQPAAGSGVDDEDLSTASRPDGTTQVTFYGHPLYEFASDGPGDTKGQGFKDEGGHWIVATPEQASGGETEPGPSSSEDSGYTY